MSQNKYSGIFRFHDNNVYMYVILVQPLRPKKAVKLQSITNSSMLKKCGLQHFFVKYEFQLLNIKPQHLCSGIYVYKLQFIVFSGYEGLYLYFEFVVNGSQMESSWSESGHWLKNNWHPCSSIWAHVQHGYMTLAADFTKQVCVGLSTFNRNNAVYSSVFQFLLFLGWCKFGFVTCQMEMHTQGTLYFNSWFEQTQ